MFRSLLTLAGLLVGLLAQMGTVAAEQPANVRLDRSGVDPEKGAVLCSPNESLFRIYGAAVEATRSEEFGQRYIIDYASLLVSQPGRQFVDEPYRAWSRRVVLECGRYAIEIEAGFYNANPQGRMGAAPEYLRASVSHDNFQVVGWTSFGACDYEPRTALSVDVKWVATDRDSVVTTVSQSCKDGAPASETSVMRVPSLQKALETHQRAP